MQKTIHQNPGLKIVLNNDGVFLVLEPSSGGSLVINLKSYFHRGKKESHETVMRWAEEFCVVTTQ